MTKIRKCIDVPESNHCYTVLANRLPSVAFQLGKKVREKFRKFFFREIEIFFYRFLASSGSVDYAYKVSSKSA